MNCPLTSIFCLTISYSSHYGPDNKLHPPIVNPNAVNKNTIQHLDGIIVKVREYLRYLNGAPSVQLQQIPPTMAAFLAEDQVKLYLMARTKDYLTSSITSDSERFFYITSDYHIL